MTSSDCTGSVRFATGAAQEKALKATVAIRVRAKERIVKGLCVVWVKCWIARQMT
jgi:hypothetical protein